MIKANVSSQIQLDKDRMESKIQDLSINSQNRVHQLDDKSKDLVRNLEERLSSHKEYQVCTIKSIDSYSCCNSSRQTIHSKGRTFLT